MTQKEILGLASKYRLDEIIKHPFAINAQVCDDCHPPIIYIGQICPMCSAQEIVDTKDKEITSIIIDRDAWESQFVDMESEKDDLQDELYSLEVERDELQEIVDYASEHCPEIGI